MRSKVDLSKGRLVATMLSGAWRLTPPPRHISVSELDEVTPLLYASGAAALGWHPIARSELRACASAEVLHQAYRLMVLQSQIREEQLEKLFRLLREQAIDAVLAKGWVVAASYPERTLRPFGDFDICVRPDQQSQVTELLQSPEARDCWVDLHKEFLELSDRPVNEIFSRSRFLSLGKEQIRVLGAEDHLALLCIHLLKHGAWRPLWLCDIAAVVEKLPDDFDWNLCFGRERRNAEWISCAIGLARDLLGAKTDHLPSEIGAHEIPAWMVESVLYQWSILHTGVHLPMHALTLMAHNLKSGRAIVKSIFQRWPDPITATFNLKGRFNNFPRAPYQMLDFARLTTTYLTQLPAKLRS